MKSRGLSALLLAALVAAPAPAFAAGHAAQGPAAVNASPAAGSAAGITGPPSPSDASNEDFAARVALDRAEQAAPVTPPVTATPAGAELPRGGEAPAAASPRPEPPARAQAPTVPSGLGGFLGLGVSAALLALSLVFALAQRKNLSALLKPLTARRTPSAPGVRAAARSAPAAGAKVPASAPSPAPSVEAARAAADVEALRQLAAELQRTITELRAERARWEREWEQREMQWSRWVKSHAFESRPAEAAAPAAAPAPVEPAPVEGFDVEAAAASGDSKAVLSAVERLLAQGLSAEEVSRRLRVGLREIQWMMRLGALEAGSRT